MSKHTRRQPKLRERSKRRLVQQIATEDQRALYDELQLRTFPPESPAKTIARLEETVRVLAIQRDDALTALNDRAMIPVTVSRLQTAVHTLRTVTVDVLATVDRLRIALEPKEQHEQQ